MRMAANERPDGDEGIFVSNDIRIRDIDANGLTFRVREAGDAGDLVILLHGFPETSAMWLDLMPRIAAAGYHVIAPDQRGKYRVVALQAGHWLAEEKPEDMAREVLAHIAAHPLT
jgi:pimeloyl-ACP methyl ester carboxylesterase